MSTAKGRLAPHGSWLLLAGPVLMWRAHAGADLFDSGELSAAAFRLGGSHAPGQPLHALIAHTVALVPLGPVPWRMVAASVAGELAAAFLFGCITGLLLEQLGTPRRPWVRAAPDAAALGAVIASPMLRQATRVEVYGLALALTAFALLQLMRWAACLPDASAALRRAAFAAGLAAVVHPPHALAAVAAGAVLLVVARRDVLRRPRALGWATAAMLAGLLGYVYLPVRGAAGAPMWGDPTHLSGFLDYVSAAAYRANLGAGRTGSFAGNAVSVARFVVVASGLVPLAGALALALHARRTPTSRSLIAATLLAVPATMTAACLQPLATAIPDNVAYAAPAVGLLLSVGAAGVATLATVPRLSPVGVVALAALALNPVSLPAVPTTLASNVPALDTLARAFVDTPPPRALVLVETDFAGASFMMARAIEGARPDVALLVTGLATSSWHWRTLASHPLFDGNPVRGRGPDAHSRFVDGAVQRALGRVPIASEADAPVQGHGAVAGPYLVVPAGGEPTESACWRTSTGERLAPLLAREAARGPGGDRGQARAVVRDEEGRRALRLAVRGHATDALHALASALPWLPRDEHRRLQGEGEIPRPLPPDVRDPHAILCVARGPGARGGLAALRDGSRG